MQLQKILKLAKSVCEEFNVMCYNKLSDDELEKVLWFAGTWIESFYYVDPTSCAKDLDCVSRVLEMHGEVFKLALNGEYSIEVDEELFRDTVKKLVQLMRVN